MLRKVTSRYATLPLIRLHYITIHDDDDNDDDDNDDDDNDDDDNDWFEVQKLFQPHEIWSK